MKYLYKILRLFFCPHKFLLEEQYQKSKTFSSGCKIEYIQYIQKCKYCGKIKVLEV